MNIKGIACLGLIASGIACTIIEIVSNKHAKKVANEEAQAAFVENEAPEVKTAKKSLDIYNKLNRREYNTINREIEKWKQTTGFNAKKSAIYKEKTSLFEEFKKNIGYAEKKDEIEGTYNASVDEFKESIDYNTTKEELESAIEEAEEAFDKKEEFLDKADGNYTADLIADLRHDAEKNKNKIVKESEDKLKELEKTLKTETAKYDKIRQEQLKELEDSVAKEKVKIEVDTKKKIRELDDEFEKAKKDIVNDIYSKRTEEEIESIEKHKTNLDILKNQEEIQKQMIDDLYNKRSTSDKIALLFKDKRIPKWLVACVGAFPVIFGGSLIYVYIKYLIEIIKKMR